MSQPYVGEIRMFAGNFPPVGWEFCQGQLLAISEQETLFNLIGTTYGGDGQETFALPDLQGRVPIHHGNGFTISEKAGTETVTVTVAQMPIHSHPMLASSGIGNNPNPQGEVLAESSLATMYAAANPATAMSGQAISSVGGSQPHNNFQPYLCVDFIISLFGIFPTQT